jgi:hypothetical protein
MAAQCAGAAIYQHSPDIRGFAASVALLTGFGNSKLPSSRAKGGRGLQLGYSDAETRPI